MYACFDIGGTAIKCALIDDKDLSLHHYRRFESKNDVADIVYMIQRMVSEYQINNQVEGICLSMPGAVEPNTGVVYGVSALSCIHGFSWKEKLSSLQLPVSIENDANCVALCESVYGKGKPYQDILSLVIGTGVGASIIKDKKIHRGATLYGGEFGFMIVQQKPTSYVTFNDRVSMKNLVKRVQTQMKDDTLDGEQIFNLSQQGNEICAKEVDDFYKQLAIGIYNMRFMYDPQLIVISGAVSQQEDFIERIQTHLVDILMSVTKTTFHTDMDVTPFMPCLTKSAFSKDANLFGALAHFLQENNR